jgi:hypothetical protein
MCEHVAMVGLHPAASTADAGDDSGLKHSTLLPSFLVIVLEPNRSTRCHVQGLRMSRSLSGSKAFFNGARKS